MLAQSYAEWCRLSGLYVANVSHVDRYRTYAQVLSPAGLTVAVVSDFLADANPALDVDDWRTYRVYEFGPQQPERIERTVAALMDVGATGLAEAVAASRSQSPFDAIQGLLSGGMPDVAAMTKLGNSFDMLQSLQDSFSGNRRGSSEPDSSLDVAPLKRETRAHLEQLLERFAQARADELQRDIERYGDPRLAPGFTVERRMKELDGLHDRWISHQSQAEAVEALAKVMAKLPKLVGQKTAGKEKKAALQLKQLVRVFRKNVRELRKVAVEDRSPDSIAFLPKLEAFEAEHASLLRPDVVGDDALRRAAAAIGPFDAEANGKSTTLSWETANGFDCDWTRFSVAVSVPAKSKAALRAGLQAVEQLQKQFGDLQNEWRQQTIESFRDVYQGQMDDEELDDYEPDAQGEPTDAGILNHVNSGSIVLSMTDPEAREVGIAASLDVEWDQEHGFELECDLDLNEEESGVTERFDCGDVTFDDVGPAITGADLQRFESSFGMELPAPYREFLQQVNGGVPSKTRVVLSMDGVEDHWDVVRFLSLSRATAEPFPPESLERSLHSERGVRVQSHLLPIARVRQGSFPPRPVGETTLAIVLTGKRAGRIVLFDAEMMIPPHEGMATDTLLTAALDETVRCARSVAPSLSALFRKLRSAPSIEVPAWLTAIRENRVEDFLAWLDRGGKLKERFVEPGSHFQPMVIDLLAAEAAPEFLERLIKNRKITPKQLREAWRRYLFLDAPRFQQLMTVLPQTDWHLAFASPFVWEHPTLLEQLAAAEVDVNAAVNDEGTTALHLAVQSGRRDAVRWLMERGADARRTDDYGSDAFSFAENGPGFNCLRLLEGRSEPVATGDAACDVPEIAELAEAAANLAPGVTIRIQVEMTSPPATRVEQIYYGTVGCHYRLTLEVGSGQVTYNDTRSPRQDYLRANTWTEALFLPILQWPELTPLWDTLQVFEFELAKALKSRRYAPTPRPDLIPSARSALEQGFNAEEAAARGVLLRK